MRVVAFDVGLRRTGVAITDASGTLARPWRTIDGGDVTTACEIVRQLREEPDGLETVVIGLPMRLDGTSTGQTLRAREFAARIATCGVRVVLQDERLTSVEAESRLALQERDWRKRKAKLDAASAAVILQDYLEQRSRQHVNPETTDEPA